MIGFFRKGCLVVFRIWITLDLVFCLDFQDLDCSGCWTSLDFQDSDSSGFGLLLSKDIGVDRDVKMHNCTAAAIRFRGSVLFLRRLVGLYRFSERCPFAKCRKPEGAR